MLEICQKCRRTNPPGATYCYYDGILLEGKGGSDVPADGRAIDVGSRPFTSSFHFPSGRVCRNFNELALACHEDAVSALTALKKGHLETFLAAQGRSDLAEIAHGAARAFEQDRGLDEFLGKLPTSCLTPARLEVEPELIDLGPLRLGEDRRCELVLHNRGMRLLYGWASCASPWLALGDEAALERKQFQLANRAVLSVRILGKHLRAYSKPQEGEIRLESNGGNASVVVRLLVAAQPFPEGVLAGALSPRGLAEMIRARPKEGTALIESGAVARWYESNGWSYPVQGPRATGAAAAQQLFEALGFVHAPHIDLSDEAVHLHGRPGVDLEYVLAAVSREKRAAVAFGRSDQPWLRVGATEFHGRRALLSLKVDRVPDQPGATLHAKVTVAANGNQVFEVPVTLAVDRVPAAAPPRAAVPLPMPSPVSPPEVKTPARTEPRPILPIPSRTSPSTGSSWWQLLLLGILLIGVVSAAGLRDYLAENYWQGQQPETALDPVPRIALQFHDAKKDDELEGLWLTDKEPTMRFGVVMLHEGKEIGQGVDVKRLTFDAWGRTNNTCLRFDRKDARLFGSREGHWQEREAKKWLDDQGQEHEGCKSVWVCDDKKVDVAQFVELVRGDQSGLLDTCRVRYVLHNGGDKEQIVGLRFLLDTYIGGNDGVPFTIPGEATLCETFMELPEPKRPGSKVPDFLEALEKPDLAHPGTVAHLRLKVEPLEPPERVTLGAWPNEKLRVLVRKNADGPSTLWDVPVLPIKSLDLNDSAIAIYWKEQPLAPGGKREVGFEYGLWDLASQGSRLAVTVDGAFRPAGQLTAVAYVNRSAGENEDETLTITLPEGFSLVEGAPTQALPPLPAGVRGKNVPVTWKFQAGAIGSYEIAVTFDARDRSKKFVWTSRSRFFD